MYGTGLCHLQMFQLLWRLYPWVSVELHLLKRLCSAHRRIKKNSPSDPKSRWLSDGSKTPQVRARMHKLCITLSLYNTKCPVYNCEASVPCHCEVYCVWQVWEESSVQSPQILCIRRNGMRSHASSLWGVSWCVYQVGFLTPPLSLSLSSGLTDNAESERFPLCSEVGGRPFPCQYVKVVPLQSWGGMLFSVWYMELHGVTREASVALAQEWLQQVHLCSSTGALSLSHPLPPAL